jgi:hypothetical protein
MARGHPSNGAVIARLLTMNSRKAIIPENHIALDHSERLRELLDKVRSRIETRRGYQRLLALVTFFILYVLALLMQQKVEDLFAVESRFLCSREVSPYIE